MILLMELVLQTTDVMLLSPDLRAVAKDLESYRADYRFLQENGIRTITQLETTILDIQSQIDVLEAERSKTDNTRRRAKTPEKRQEAKDRKKERQLIAMREFGIAENLVYMDKQSGKDFERKNYKRLIRKLKKDDTLVVKSIDRLGRMRICLLFAKSCLF